MFHYTQCGLDNVWLLNGYELHETEYGPGVSFEDGDGLDRAIAMWLVEHKPKLNGKEFRFLRKQLELSQHKLADIFGNDEQSVAKWEKTGRIPKWADRMLRALVVEFYGGNTKIIELVELLNNLDQEAYAGRVNFKETEAGWMRAA